MVISYSLIQMHANTTQPNNITVNILFSVTSVLKHVHPEKWLKNLCISEILTYLVLYEYLACTSHQHTIRRPMVHELGSLRPENSLHGLVCEKVESSFDK